jgi:uncharacterized cupin superfamily protein
MPVIRPEQQQVEVIPYFDPNNPNYEQWLSKPAGLTQIGVFIHVLQPGTRSSINHWHSDEDELVYVLEGEVTAIEGDVHSVLKAGDAVAFKANVPVAHSLWNQSANTVRCLIVGTRAQTDRITYPKHDRILLCDRRTDSNVWTDLNGQPASDPYSS